MEPFLDGGILEILIALLFAVSLNFIFDRRILLILFSLAIIASPVLLFFVPRSEWYTLLVIVNIFNSMFLVSLLWKNKNEHPMEPLFKTDRIKQKLTGIQQRIMNFFKKENV